MTFREPILENLTKTELIELIRHMALEPDKRTIAYIMWQAESAQAKTARDGAAKFLENTIGDFSAETFAKRMVAHKKFDKALDREREATIYYLRSDTP